jgi:hypothetical protein
MLSEAQALQRNAKHEARVSNSFDQVSRTLKNMIRDSSLRSE